tara:strand:+ start:207 stop:764 length:558 start_codon:yes stop_codon:yes gene_type:complete
MKKILICTFFLFGLGFSHGQVATTPKVVAVDIEHILRNYSKLQAAQKMLNSSKDNAQQEIEILKEEGRKLIEKGKALESKINNPALTPAAQEQAKKEFLVLRKQVQEKERDLLSYVQRTDATLKQRLKSILELHMGEIRDMVAVVAKEKGADLALNKSLKDFVLYSADYFDITKAVLSRLNIAAK